LLDLPSGEIKEVTTFLIKINSSVWIIIVFSNINLKLFAPIVRMLDTDYYYMFLVVDPWGLIIEFPHPRISLMVHRSIEEVEVPLMNIGCFHR
jgi:hypothetical protein